MWLSRQIWIVLLILFFDILSLSLLVPMVPELVPWYGWVAWWFLWLSVEFWLTISLTVYSLCGFIAAPYLWQLSDRHGRKPWLLVCIVGTIVSFGILWWTQSIVRYLIARIVNWLTGWNISIIQAIMSDLAETPKQRTQYFWLVGMMFGLWFVIGPLFSLGLFALWQESWGNGLLTIFAVSTILNVVELGIVWFFFRETHDAWDDVRPLSLNPFQSLIETLRIDAIRTPLVSLTLFGVAWFAFISIYALGMEEWFGLSVMESWYFLAGSAMISAFNQWYLLPKVWLRYFSPKTLRYWTHWVCLTLYFVMGLLIWWGWMWSETLRYVIGWFVLCWYWANLFGALIFPVYSSHIVEVMPWNQKGKISWVIASFQSIGMIIWPLFWSLLIHTSFPIVWVSWLLVFVSFVLVLQNPRE